MRGGDGRFLAAAGRVIAPFIMLFAVLLLLSWPPGSGVGFAAGLVASLGLLLHMLIFGAAASRAAGFVHLQRAVLGLGVFAAVAGLATTQTAAATVREAGVFVATLAMGALVTTLIAGRAARFNEDRR